MDTQARSNWAHYLSGRAPEPFDQGPFLCWCGRELIILAGPRVNGWACVECDVALVDQLTDLDPETELRRLN